MKNINQSLRGLTSSLFLAAGFTHMAEKLDHNFGARLANNDGRVESAQFCKPCWFNAPAK